MILAKRYLFGFFLILIELLPITVETVQATQLPNIINENVGHYHPLQDFVSCIVEANLIGGIPEQLLSTDC